MVALLSQPEHEGVSFSKPLIPSVSLSLAPLFKQWSASSFITAEKKGAKICHEATDKWFCYVSRVTIQADLFVK